MKKLVVALGIALALCSVGAVQGWRGLRTQRGDNAALAERVAALELAAQAPALTAASSPDSLPQQLVAQEVPTRSAVTTGSPTDSAAPAATPPESQVDPMLAAATQFLSTPGGQEMMRAMVRTNIRQQYPDLQARLNLSPEEADRLYELLAKHASELTLEAMQTASTDGLDPYGRLGVDIDMDERERANDREIEALLGANFRKWKEYERETQESNRQRYVQQGIDQLRAAVTTTGNPITDDRFKMFREAVEAEQQRFERESPIGSVQQYAQRLPEMNRRLLTVAAEHLDADQLEGYQRYLKQQEDMARMMGGMMGGAAGESTPAAPR